MNRINKNFFVTFLAGCLSFTTLLAARQLNADSLKLIPTPRTVTAGNGSFTFDKKVTLWLSSPKDQADLFAASQIVEELKNNLGFEPAVSKLFKPKAILLLRFGQLESAKLLKKFNLEPPKEIGKQGYVLQVGTDNIVIAANSDQGLFYGAQTLKQLIRSNRTGSAIPCLTVTDWPTLEYRGWMDDISRGPIPTLEFLKEEVVRLAEYKLNYFTLYTENVFRLKGLPDIAPVDGITAEEIAQLTTFARKYHMEIIGNEQSFGHWEKTLASPFWDAVRENKWTLSPAVEETYTLLKQIYSEIVPAYESKFFNINCDETGGLGVGKSRKMLDTTTVGGIYAYHINRINNLLKPYGRRIMMWGDIAVNNKEIIQKLPKDMIILSWGYGAADSFEPAIKPFKESGFEFMVAPGVSCWSEIWPNMNNACVNIANYVRDGAKLGAIGMMNTAWDDDGENLFNYNWHGLIWGAECSWNTTKPLTGEAAKADFTKRLNHFNDSFSELMFGNPKVAGLLLKFDTIRQQPVRGAVGDGSFWMDPFDQYPENTSEAYQKANEKIIEMTDHLIGALRSEQHSVTRNAVLLDQPLFAAERVRFASMENLSRIALAKALKTQDANDISAAKRSIAALLPRLHQLKQAYIGLWNRENRPWWLDKILAKYDQQGNRLLDVGQKVLIEPQASVSNGQRLISLRTPFNDQEIHYSINDAVPTVRSEIYTKPIPISGTSLVRACVIDNKETGPVSEMAVMVHKAIGKIVKINTNYSRYNPVYTAGGDQGLADGLKGSSNFADGRWQGYSGQNLDVVIDLGQVTPVKNISVDFLQNAYSWILLPQNVEFYASTDGVTFNKIADIANPVDPKEEGTIIHTFKSEFNQMSTRYLRVVGVNVGTLPAWHHAAGGSAFLFADEIVVN